MKNIFNASFSLIAKSPEELTKLQLLNSLINDREFKYRDRAQLSDGRFICWFDADATKYIPIKRVK
jgi:hypothetical protein